MFKYCILIYDSRSMLYINHINIDIPMVYYYTYAVCVCICSYNYCTSRRPPYGGTLIIYRVIVAHRATDEYGIGFEKWSYARVCALGSGDQRKSAV